MSRDFDQSHQGREDISTVVVSDAEVEVVPPKMFRVLLHNDDYTPMEFVVNLIEVYFGKDQSQATRIMLDVHHRGVGVCGVYTKEIAESKTSVVMEKARRHLYPLKCTFEEDDESCEYRGPLR